MQPHLKLGKNFFFSNLENNLMLLSNEKAIDQFLCHYTCGPSHVLADEVL